MTDEVVWTVEAVRALGATTTLEEAASVLGVGRTKAYELAQRGEFPVTAIRVGRRYRVSVLALLRLLGGQPNPPLRWPLGG